MLYEAMMEDMRFKEKRRVPDGLGGWNVVWTDGAEFRANIDKTSTLDALIAEKEGITELYTITVNRDVPLEFHDIIERVSDGQIFRITSNVTDSKSPVFSAVDMGQVRAEAWHLE